MARHSLENSKNWLFLSVGCLLLGGALSLVLVLSRAPLINQFLGDPGFAKRILVVHVTLTLGCWFFGYLATLFYLLPGPMVRNSRLWLSLLGVGVFALGGFMGSGEPILSNYIPVIHNPVFLFGSGLFLTGVCFSFFDRRLFFPISLDENSPLDQASAFGIRAAVLCFLIGVLSLIYSVYATDMPEDLFAYYEILFWGSGHIFQLAQISALISVWLIIYKRLTGSPLFNINVAYLVFGLLLAPAILSPLLYLEGTSGARYYAGFELVMRWCTWPSAALVMALLLSNYSKLRTKGRVEFYGLICSCVLLLLGFALGAFISGSNTLVPAHYHATIGAVTVAHMTMSFILFSIFGFSASSEKIKKWIPRQPILFAIGQFTFASGFAVAGYFGLGRKVYGAEQVLSKFEQYIGLGIMGAGGLLAISGGALFFYLLFRSFKPVQEID